DRSINRIISVEALKLLLMMDILNIVIVFMNLPTKVTISIQLSKFSLLGIIMDRSINRIISVEALKLLLMMDILNIVIVFMNLPTKVTISIQLSKFSLLGIIMDRSINRIISVEALKLLLMMD